MNSTAREARNAALERHKSDLRYAKAEYVANVKVWASVALAAGMVIGHLLSSSSRVMELPEPDTIVVAYTTQGEYIAYLDSNGDFRSFSDGMPIGQVINWDDK